MIGLFLSAFGLSLLFPRSSEEIDELSDPAALFDMTDPVVFAYVLLSLVFLIPALTFANWLVGLRPFGLSFSVTGRLRWGWFAKCTGIAGAIFGVGYLVSFAISAVQGEPIALFPVNPQLPIMLLLTLLLVPFQAAAEEYVFRGYLMQSIGTWLRHPAWAILIPVPFFVLGHDYELLGQLDVGLFAVAAGWLTWRTGGLEAAIALHIVINCAVCVFGAFGLVDVNATDGTVAGLVLSLIIVLAFTVAVTVAANRNGIERTRLNPLLEHPLP